MAESMSLYGPPIGGPCGAGGSDICYCIHRTNMAVGHDRDECTQYEA